MLLRAKLMMIVGVAVATMVLGFWLYYRNTQKRLQEAAAENARQEVMIQEQKAIREEIEKNIEESRQIRQDVNKQIQKTQRSVDDIRGKFTPRTNPETGVTTTIGQAAVEKTESIERAVNRGTQDQLRCFELLSGNPLTEEERNGKKTNSLCPDLLAQPAAVKPAAAK
jgi:septal ring factor EnvC (AmiA/AmiB activator)